MKYIKGFNIFESNTEEYYKEISIEYVHNNIPKDRFIDINNRVLNFVKANISKEIISHNPRVKIITDNGQNSGIYSENNISNLTIHGFDYFTRSLRIYALTDDYYIVQFTMTGYSIYFLCDQFDGLVKLLIDYKICDEPINESGIFKKEDYYVEMSYVDGYNMLKSSPKIEFNNIEKVILEDIADKKGYNYSIENDNKRINLYKMSLSSKMVLGDFTKSVYKFEDEWYIFMKYNKKMSGLSEVYYKCDGFEGLLKCINDIMPDIPNKKIMNESKANFLYDCELYSKITASELLELENYKIDIQYYTTISDCINSNFFDECPSIRYSSSTKIFTISFNRYLYGIKWIDLFSIDDDYFIVKVFEIGDKYTFYKCDQVDGLLSLLNDLGTFRPNDSYQLDESLSHQDALVKKADELEYEKWIRDRKPDDFNKYDTLVVFEIIKNLDPYYFGPTIDKYPFGKSRESSFWLRNRINEFRNYFIDRTLNEIKAMSDFFFTNNSFDGIHIKHYNNHIHFDKYQDEWYDVIISSSQGDQINYICDSIDGLKEVINMVGDLKFESESDINESLNESETLVKKLTESEYYNFINTHNRDIQTEDDVEVYMNFLREIFEEKEIEPDQHFIENSKSWDVTINEYGEEDKVISTGHFYFDKFEDEWYLVERQVDGWSVIVDYWLVDTKEGFQQLKNDIFE